MPNSLTRAVVVRHVQLASRADTEKKAASVDKDEQRDDSESKRHSSGFCPSDGRSQATAPTFMSAGHSGHQQASDYLHTGNS